MPSQANQQFEAMRRVGVIVRADEGFGREILAGIAAYAHAHQDWALAWLRAHEPTAEDVDRLGPVVGFITAHRDAAFLADLIERGLPAVVVGGVPPQPGDVHITSDHGAVGRMAAEHLVAQGYRNLAYFGRKVGEHFQQREAGLCEAAAEYGCSYQAYYPNPGQATPAPSDVRAWFHEQVEHWLHSLPKPVGILADVSFDAHLLIGECARLQLNVPDSVAVLTVDTDELVCSLTHPTLSALDHGAYQFGEQAAVWMSRLLRGETPPGEPVVVPPIGVTQRESTQSLVIDQPGIALAVRYIREHATEGIKVSDVLEVVPESRRVLEYGFNKWLNRTVHQEIVRVRLERARELLAETDLSMPEVSDKCGFSNPSQLSHQFRKHVGMTPTAYRRRRRQRPEQAGVG